MYRFLILDTSGDTLSVGAGVFCPAADKRAQLIAQVVMGPQVDHSRNLPVVVGQVMTRAGWEWATLDVVGVVLGPGSFTGLRLGLAYAKGIAQARGIKLVGLPTFAGLWHAVLRCARFNQVWEQGDFSLRTPVVLCIPAHRRAYYTLCVMGEPSPGFFFAGAHRRAIQILSVEALGRMPFPCYAVFSMLSGTTTSSDLDVQWCVLTAQDFLSAMEYGILQGLWLPRDAQPWYVYPYSPAIPSFWGRHSSA